MDKGITRNEVERVARVYRYNLDAARALDIDLRSFGRLCRQFDIETPYVRRRRQLADCRQPATVPPTAAAVGVDMDTPVRVG